MNLQPLGDRLIVEALEEEESTVSGIVLPDTAKEKPQRGRVLSVGPGSRNDKGEIVPMDVAEHNAGLEASVVVDKVRGAGAGMGLNVDTGEVEDLIKAGIIDPTMVTRSALQNAASIAKNILTTEAVVAEAPEKTPAGAGAGMPDMGGMM